MDLMMRKQEIFANPTHQNLKKAFIRMVGTATFPSRSNFLPREAARWFFDSEDHVKVSLKCNQG